MHIGQDAVAHYLHAKIHLTFLSVRSTAGNSGLNISKSFRVRASSVVNNARLVMPVAMQRMR